MDSTSVRTLNQLNHDFYTTVAKSFDDSRSFFWTGWEKLKPHIQQIITNKKNTKNKFLRVLDIGCGNGRFAEWLDFHTFQSEYHGIDFNTFLLESARKKRNHLAHVSTQFTQIDIVDSLLKNKQFLPTNTTYDLVVCFGVLHHIPGSHNRQKIIQNIVQKTHNLGLVVVATWQFNTIPSLMKRSYKLSEFTLIHDPEPGDYILDWQRKLPNKKKPQQERLKNEEKNKDKKATHQRYCHLISAEETQHWWSSANMQLMLDYTADGPQGKSNHYFIATHNSH